MTQDTLIPLQLLADLRCSNCNKFVSCGPVHVLLNEPEGFLYCGRCHFLGNYSTRVFHNKAFECIASMFTYPCCNWEQHCPAYLPWNNSLDHEYDCSYRSCCSRFWSHPCISLCSGTRELPFGNIRLFNINEKILDYLRCALCGQYLSSDPIYIRPDGSNICHRCVYSNGVPKDCVRNRAYETIACIVLFPCVYKNWGCPTRLKFGRDLWQHESHCSYSYVPQNQTQTVESIRKSKKPHRTQNSMHPQQSTTHPQQPQQKERGVIQTHSGHYYGTISPLNVPFAPPTEKSEFDVNKELLKSMKKREERKFARAEDIESQFDRMTGENASVSTENSFGIYDRNSYNRYEDHDRQHQQQLKVKPLRRDSGYSTPNRPKTVPTLPQQHFDVSRSASFQYPTTAVGTHDPRINQPRRSLLKKNATPSPEPFALPAEEIRMQNSINLSRTESIGSNKDLMMELRRKQQARMKNQSAIWEPTSQ